MASEHVPDRPGCGVQDGDRSWESAPTFSGGYHPNVAPRHQTVEADQRGHTVGAGQEGEDRKGEVHVGIVM